jgi:transmembrane sensor
MDALLASADEARVAGRYAEAASLLERVVAKGGGGPQTSLAEFSLGRLYLDSLGAPARAAGHFSRALTGALPGALAEDAYARLVEAYARAGAAARAREVAERYRSAYPGGRRRHDVDRWSAPSP